MKRTFDIVTIGSATRDVFLRSRAIRVMRDENFSTGEAECFALGSKIDVDELVFETGGGGSNTAVGFARQGFRVGFVGKIGATDARGREIVRALKSERVSTSLIAHDRRQGTGYSVLLLTERGERTALVFRGASSDFASKDFRWGRMSAGWWYISSLGGQLKALQHIWRQAKRANIRIAWNPGAKELALGMDVLRPLIAQTDIFFVNEEEAGTLMRLTHHQDLEAFEALRRLVKGIAVVTQGTEGSLAGTSYQAWHCGTRRVRVVDTTGAGDAFASGFVGTFMRNGSIPKALRFGTDNSESVIRSIGAKHGLLKRPTTTAAPMIREIVE